MERRTSVHVQMDSSHYDFVLPPSGLTNGVVQDDSDCQESVTRYLRTEIQQANAEYEKQMNIMKKIVNACAQNPGEVMAEWQHCTEPDKIYFKVVQMLEDQKEIHRQIQLELATERKSLENEEQRWVANETELNRLRDFVEHHQEMLTKYKSDQQEMQGPCERAKTILAGLDAEWRSIEAQLEETKTEVSDRQAFLQQKQGQLAHMEDIGEQKISQLQKELQQAVDEQSRLQAQFQLGVESRMKVVDELRQFVQDQDDLSIDLSLPQSSLVDWLRENLDILKRATSKTNKQHSLIQEENYELKREIDQKQIKMTEAITKLNQLKENDMTLKLKSAAEQQKFRTDMEQIDRSVVTIKEEMTRTRRQQEELRKQLDEETRHLEKEKSALEGEINEAKQQLQDIDEQEEKRKSENENQQIQLNSKIGDVQANIFTMQNQLENIESSKKDLEFTLEAHRGDCGKLQQQIDDIHSEISRLEEESKSRMEQFNQLKAQKDHEANELSQAIQIRVRQVKALREQLDGQLKQKELLSHQFEQMKVRLQKEHTDGETARRRLEAARAIQTRFQAEVERLQNELGIEDQRLHSSRNTGGPAGICLNSTQHAEVRQSRGQCEVNQHSHVQWRI